jgi:hypothetical protein
MREYLKVLRETRQNIKNLTNIIEQNPDDSKKISSLISDIQELMIQLGNELEQRFRLQNSRIMHLLETGCELCYQAFSGNMDVPSFCEFINLLTRAIEHEYVWSTPAGAYDLSIAAIIKNEEYILEWIAYHLMVGVQHFYIYDNESTDGLERKLQKYIQDGTVTYIYWPSKYQQIPVYKHAVSHFQYDTKWLAIIDGDEYIVPIQEGTLIPQVLDEIDIHYINPIVNGCDNTNVCDFLGAVGVNWHVYGTSGHKTRCPGLLLENYTYRAADDSVDNCHIKTICNPRLVADIINPHYVIHTTDYCTISENGSVIPHAHFFDASYKKLCINHYLSKSEEEYLEKNSRGWPDGYKQLSSDALRTVSEDYCQVCDPIMNRYIDELKKRVAAYEESNRQFMD